MTDPTRPPSDDPTINPPVPPGGAMVPPSPTEPPVPPPHDGSSQPPVLTPEPIEEEVLPVAPEPTEEVSSPIASLPPVEETPPMAAAPILEPELTPIPPPPPANGGPTVNGKDDGAVKGSIFRFVVPVVGGLLVLTLLFLLVTRVILPRFRGQGEAETITLTYWGLWEDPAILKSVITDYQLEHPNVTINYQQQSHKDYRERLQSALAGAGTQTPDVLSREAPDIFRFHNTWVPMLQKDLAVVPTSVFDLSSFRTTFYDVAEKDLVRNGSILGVPLMIDGLGLYYNTTLFTAGGKSPPTNWEELRQTAFDLTVRDESGKIQTAGIALGTTGNVQHWSDILGMMLLQNGANPAAPTDASAADALRFYTIFSRSDRVWDETLPDSVFAFATGKVAMIFAPSWEAHTIASINPNLEFDVVPVPQLPGTNITWASYWVEGVSAKSEHQEAAFDFLKFLSDRTTLTKLYTEASKTRLFGEPYSRRDLASSIQGSRVVGAYITQAETAQSFYLASRTFDNGINDKVIKYYEDAINTINNDGEDPEAVLETVAQGVAQVLSQYGVSTSR